MGKPAMTPDEIYKKGKADERAAIVSFLNKFAFNEDVAISERMWTYIHIIRNGHHWHDNR
jgi:hypothetical protein